MLKVIIRKLKKKELSSSQFRTQMGISAAVLGLFSNTILFIAKLVIGLAANSVSIMADAINNLSDTASSFLTLVGFYIAGKPADEEHPYGHERFEYISGLIVSIIVTYVGFQFLHSSIDKILNPTGTSLTPIALIVLLLSILLKIWQGRMYLGFSKAIKSETLRATAQDSFNDVFTTITVLLSAVVEFFTGWRIDGYAGFLIALFILYSGIKMIKDFIDELMGSRPTTEDIETMEQRLKSYPKILGFHDLLVHSYGPNKNFASVHIEVNESWHLEEAHEVIDHIEKDFKKNLNVELVCHLDPVPVNDRNFMATFHIMKGIVQDLNLDLKMHDFRMEKDPPSLDFDLVVPPKCPVKDAEILKMINTKVAKIIGNQEVNINFDHNYLLKN